MTTKKPETDQTKPEESAGESSESAEAMPNPLGRIVAYKLTESDTQELQGRCDVAFSEGHVMYGVAIRYDEREGDYYLFLFIPTMTGHYEIMAKPGEGNGEFLTT